MNNVNEIEKDQKTRRNIHMTIAKALTDLPKISVFGLGETYDVINVCSDNQFVPDLSLVWSDKYRHYRVYIYIGTQTDAKQNAGYAIAVIKNTLAAAGLVVLYQFLHKHRANNRSSE